MPQYQGQTDTILKVRLKSLLLSVRWGAAEIGAGGTIALEAMTAYVSDGSEIKITLKDLQGETIEALQGKVFANLFRTQYRISKPNATGGMYFEAELPAHSLKGVSPRIAVGPPVKITGLEFLDGAGAALTRISRCDLLAMEGKVEGPPEGTACILCLYLDEGKETPRLIESFEARIENRKVSAAWAFQPPAREPQHPVQKDLDKEGGAYAPLNYLFSIECLGVEAMSEPAEYVSWVEVDLGHVSGKAVLLMPDGSEKSEAIPSDGILKVEAPGAGRIFIKAIEPD